VPPNPIVNSQISQKGPFVSKFNMRPFWPPFLTRPPFLTKWYFLHISLGYFISRSIAYLVTYKKHTIFDIGQNGPDRISTQAPTSRSKW